MNVAIIVFPGSNCDNDLKRAVKKVFAIEPTMVWHSEGELPPDTRLVFLPGGFSYGDYIRSGAIAANSPIMRDVYQKALAQKIYLIGICNGFQILVESQLLPGVLIRNISLTFRAKEVTLDINNKNTPYSRFFPNERCILPVAHMDGNYYADPETLRQLNDNQQIIFQYAMEDNPNGSLNNIAGIMNEAGNVFGMMPHPERAVGKQFNNQQGVHFFESLREFVA